MPTIITGRAHSRRREVFFDMVRKEAENGADVLVLVPDQYTFAMDRELYGQLGVKLFNNIKTGGISAYSEKLCRELGGLAGENADERAKLMAMYRAQSALAAEKPCSIIYYRRSLLKPAFVTQTISLLSGLNHSGITPETLRAAAENAPAGAVRLADISLIFDAYNRELAAMELADVSSVTARAAALAGEQGSFRGMKVFFDGFTSFSKDELMFVKAVMGSSAGTVFSIVCGESGSGLDPFSETRRTVSRIQKLSQELNRQTEMIPAEGCSQTEPLAAVNAGLFEYQPEKTFSQGLVKTAAATDIYEECDYICAETVRLAREEGYRLRDIAVVCGALENSSRILAAACERYGIPYFIDQPKNALNSIPAKYLMSILDAAVTRKYRTDALMRIIKSPLSIFLEYDACDLEEHCRYWGIDGDMWKEPFIDENSDRSRRVEENRRRIIEPFERFRNACADGASAGDMCQALYTLLDDLKMSEKVYSKVRAGAGNDTDLEVTRSLKQVWLGLVDSIRSIYAGMKDEKLSLRGFAELIKLMLGTVSLSSPPQKADCLLIGDADRTRLPAVKALFIMQANDGLFPKGISRSELLGDGDIAALEKLDADISLSPRVCLDSGRMQTYTAVTAPSERLYVTYSESDRTGAPVSPSQLPGALRSLFEDDIHVKISELPPETFCVSYRTAFYKYLEHNRDKTVSSANILASLAGSEEYLARIENAERQAEQGGETISPELSKKLFYRSGFNITATRVSDYYRCPFSYFCKNGLKLPTPSSIKLDPVNIGRIAHKCLETVMSTEKDGTRVYDTEFTSLPDSELERRVGEAADRFVTEKLGGSRRHDQTFLAAAERLKSSILKMVLYFRDELKDSLFVPAAFEYDLGGSPGKGCTLVGLDIAGEKIRLFGQADRVDLYRTPECTWLRIVDYKTGSQSFSESEIYHGLGLQMLIYLLAVTSGVSELTGGEALPAGVMYSHIREVKPKLDPETVKKLELEGTLEERISLECARSYKPDGMMLGEEIYPGLNTAQGGVYTIFTFNKQKEGEPLQTKKGTTEPVSQEKLLAMEHFALEKVSGMAEALAEGKISPDPIRLTKDVTSCTYCDFRSICRRPDPKKLRTVTQEDGQRLEEELGEIIKKLNAET